MIGIGTQASPTFQKYYVINYECKPRNCGNCTQHNAYMKNWNEFLDSWKKDTLDDINDKLRIENQSANIESSSVIGGIKIPGEVCHFDLGSVMVILIPT